MSAAVTTAPEFAHYVHDHILPAAFALLPGGMDTREARAELIAIGMQESGFNARVQGGAGTVRGTGPAHGFWQFERAGGVTEILTHATTGPIIAHVCRTLLYEPTPNVCWSAIADHDVLAACFARLLLYVDPRKMPAPLDVDKGWAIYHDNWRPGAPHPDVWPVNYGIGWQVVSA